jgi:hypothetical protein
VNTTAGKFQKRREIQKFSPLFFKPKISLNNSPSLPNLYLKTSNREKSPIEKVNNSLVSEIAKYDKTINK